MSRIDDFIADLCPGGVEQKSLGDVGSFIRGNGLQKSDLTDTGVPAIHYGQIHTFYGTWAGATNSFVSEALAIRLRRAKSGDLVIATTSEDDIAVGKATAWIGEGEVAVSGDAYIYHHTLDPRYVSYFFQTNHFQDQKKRHITGTKVRRISGDSLAKIRIPVPPLEIQREIVRVLDTFAELEAELESELEARKRQYVHYRDLLLTFGDDKPRIPLGQLTSGIVSGRTRLRSEQGAYLVYGSTGPIGYTEIPDYEGEALLIARVGANAGHVQWVDGEFGVSDNTLIALPIAIWDVRFAFHQLRQMNLNQFAVGGGQPLLTAGRLKELSISVPTLREQRRIVQILDSLESLASDLSVGLPAELTARRKQYEHYRDRLLTFKELSS